VIRAILLVVVGCSSSPDRVAGKWQSDTGKGPIIELRADGTLDMPPHADPRCEDDKAALDACRAKQRWSRDGTTVTLRIGAVAHASAGMAGAFEAEGPPCRCTLESHAATLDADTLTIGKERAVRVRENAPRPAGGS
jgi:hypothetical protein